MRFLPIIRPTAASTTVAARRASTTVATLAARWRRLLRRRWGAAFGRRVLVSQHRLARQFHAVVLVDGDDLHLDLVAGADQPADLLRIDLDLQQAWCCARDLGTRLTQCRKHRAQDIATCIAGLFECRLDDRLVDAVDLQIELNAGDATTRTGDLE